MNDFPLTLCGVDLVARAGGALWWPDRGTLIVSDLHLGKSERIARRGGTMLPPYETLDTLSRLDAEIAATAARQVICLGDSFDDASTVQALPEAVIDWLTRLMAGRSWIWVEGNHDPGPVALSGTHRSEIAMDPLILRHIAQPGARGEISGHFHPKARIGGRGRSVSRACFLADAARIVLPAFGTYTGGLYCDAPVLRDLMRPDALAILTGPVTRAIPMPGRAA